MDTQAKRDYVRRFYRELVRDGYMDMGDREIVAIVNSLNAAELAKEVKDCKEVDNA